MTVCRHLFSEIFRRAAGRSAAVCGRGIAVGLALMLSLVAGAIPARAFLLHGIVYGDSAPLANATVELADAGTAAAVGSVVTDATGSYSFSVAAGSFDLRVSAAGFEPSSVESIAVVAGDVTQDVSLMRKLALSGVVRTFEGVPVAGARVEIRGGDPDDSSTWGKTLAGPVTTTSAGEYSFALVPSGIVTLNVLNVDDDNPAFPAFWHYEEPPFTISGTVDRSVTLPHIATISGRLTDAGGNPVAGGTVAARNVVSGWWYARSTSRTDTSGATGEYTVHVFATGDTHFTVTPPPGHAWSVFETTLDVGADTARDFAFAAISLSGVVRTSEGVPVAGARVEILGGDTGDDHTWLSPLASPVTTNGAGEYAVALAPSGTVVLSVMNTDDGNPLFPPSWHVMEEIFTIDASGTRDVMLPKIATISGRTIDAAGLPVEGVELEASNVWYVSSYASCESRKAVSDGTGAYLVRVFATGDTHVTAVPPPGHGWSAFEAVLDVRADTVRDFIFTAVGLSGVVRTSGGLPVAGAQVDILGGDSGDDQTWLSPLVGSVTTPGGGDFAFALVPNGTVMLSVVNGADDNPLFPASWHYMEGPFATGVTGTRDVTLPLVAAISGRTTDANGVPVPGVEVVANNVTWGESWYARSNSRNALSVVSGAYAVRAFAIGDTSLIVTPPAGSGFSSSAPVGFSLTGDRLFNVLLMLADTTPPVILAGPVAAKITDTTAVIEWQTDEPARGGVLCGSGVPSGTQIDESDYVTAHAAALSGLLPGTEYSVQVFAADRSGNGPVNSGVISFLTLPAADTAPPAFTFGPIVSSVTAVSAAVEWATDEVTSCTVLYGEAGGFLGSSASDGLLAKSHGAELAGLLPATGYELRVDCADAAGNGSSSAVIPFTTAPAPDVTPPAIVDGPLVIDVTATTATVVWTTDEPATSGVSWNDGTRYDLVTDPALVTAHGVTLTGLLPATAYVLTVSSTDGGGNGPTLGGPIAFTTKAAADSRPPVIIDGPTVVNVTHDSAVIRWETDEPADGVVEYGLAADQLLMRDAHASLTQPHNQTLTGLDAGTAYFLRVCSTDAAGNTGCSGVVSFTTDGADGGRMPVVVAGPTVAYSSDRTASVFWSTDVPTDSVVQYQEEGGSVRQRTDGERVLRHQVTLKNLDAATQYAVQVRGADAFGGPAAGGTGAPGLTLLTAGAPDTAPPVIVSGPTVTPQSGGTRAVVQWETDELADSVVSYGRRGAGYGEQAGTIARTTAHRVVLTNLLPGKVYQLRVQSADPEGNGPTVSAPLAFTAAAPPPLFADSFDDGLPSGDPHWQVAAGSWSVAAQAYVAGTGAGNVSRILLFDPVANPFPAGVIDAKLTLVPASPQKANGSVVFGYLDPSRYRYVRLEAGKVMIGQTGAYGGSGGGVKKTFETAMAVSAPTALTVKVYPTGYVSVSIGATKVGSWKFPTAVPGGVGLAASKSTTIFDDVAVWDETRL